VCGSCFFSAMVVVVFDVDELPLGVEVVPFHDDDEVVGVVDAAVVPIVGGGGAAGVDGF
jgi:glutaredoxin 2